MKLKYETFSLVKSFINYVQTQYLTIVKCIRSNNDPEFMLKYLYMTHELLHQTTYTYTP